MSRSPQSSSTAIIMPPLDAIVPASMLKPGISITALTPGSAPRVAAKLRTTASVRGSAALSGSCTSTKTAPWSSVGRKLEGRLHASAITPAITAAKIAMGAVIRLSSQRSVCW